MGPLRPTGVGALFVVGSTFVTIVVVVRSVREVAVVWLTSLLAWLSTVLAVLSVWVLVVAARLVVVLVLWLGGASAILGLT